MLSPTPSTGYGEVEDLACTSNRSDPRRHSRVASAPSARSCASGLRRKLSRHATGSDGEPSSQHAGGPAQWPRGEWTPPQRRPHHSARRRRAPRPALSRTGIRPAGTLKSLANAQLTPATDSDSRRPISTPEDSLAGQAVTRPAPCERYRHAPPGLEITAGIAFRCSCRPPKRSLPLMTLHTNSERISLGDQFGDIALAARARFLPIQRPQPIDRPAVVAGAAVPARRVAPARCRRR